MDNLSARETIHHLAEYYGVCPEEYVFLDRTGLEATMPHRETALCIDFGLIPLNEEHCYAFGVSHIPKDSPETDGHFPGKTCLPGHWALEKMCLTSALLGNKIASKGTSNRKHLLFLAKIYRAEFVRPIPSGSVLVMKSVYQPEGILIDDCHIYSTDKRRAIFEIHAHVNGDLCVTAAIGAALVPIR